MCGKYPCLRCHGTIEEAPLNQVLPGVSIDSTETVVQKYAVRVRVHSSGERHSSLLSTRKVDASLAYLCVLVMGKNFQVVSQRARINGRLKPVNSR
jgi:hypothetical protein